MDLNKKAIIHAKTLMDRHNDNPNNDLKDQLTEKDYLFLLNEVLHVINSNPNASFDDIKNILYHNKNIDNILKEFVFDKKLTSSLAINYGTRFTRDRITIGNMIEEENFHKENNIDTIYDIASTSKPFLAFAALRASEKDNLDLDKPINEYAKEFTKIGNTTFNDYLHFKVDIQTDGRLVGDHHKTFNDSHNALINAWVRENFPLQNNYTDIGSMILVYALEKFYKLPYEEILKNNVFDIANMKNTHMFVPNEKKHLVASNNNNCLVDSNGNIISNKLLQGSAHDPKANFFMNHGQALGHAGIFTTTSDITNLAYALSDHKILNEENMSNLVKTEVGLLNHPKFNKPTNYLGKHVYLKQPTKDILRLSDYFSGKAFFCPGFTGTSVSIDPVNDISISILSNRLHNRLYDIGNFVNEIEVEKTGAKKYKDVYISIAHAPQIRNVVEVITKLCFQYQFLEILFNKQTISNNPVRRLTK